MNEYISEFCTMQFMHEQLQEIVVLLMQFTDREQKYNRTIEDLQARLKTVSCYNIIHRPFLVFE